MIKKFLATVGIQIDNEQENKLNLLLNLFKEWNKKINLSSFNNNETIIIKHFVDSLLPIQSDEFKKAKTVLDLGTGGGFPGLPLAIIFPKKEFLLVDSVSKKINAIENIASELELKNIQTRADRIEELAHYKNIRGQFDVVTERALSKFSTMLEYCLPCAKIGGSLIAYQTLEIKTEVKNKKEVIKLLGGKLDRIEEYLLPNDTGKRLILFIKKIKSTPKKFPRAIGIPKKSPL